ncbi:Hpt domain-containing protein [Gilvimarinus polysaccharolyticus]|uniref:Hpt domain-containing protein n=1 Tax=Gilvimarinus polysaccharolyticus TaxID=863921 RepID=UPI0006736697|nr:Hpt domain-containing protein [Gilvimarinus polysaccharolyticus]
MSDNHLIDHEILSTLQDVMGDDFGLLIETYLSDSEGRLSAMQKALASGDAEALRCAAHSFKGSCSNVGATTLAAQCQLIEQAALNKQLIGLETSLVTLHSEFSQVRRQLAGYQ